MGRWEPDAQARLQRAAVELFVERGYAEVTVDEIARRAGLTKRSFFNHFTDKREVLFAGAQDFEDSVVAHLAEAVASLEPIDAALAALTSAALELVGYADFARMRQELIASSTELRERDLIKMAALASAIADTLRRCGIPQTRAKLTAQAAVAVFTSAYATWSEKGPTADLRALTRQSLTDLRRAVGGAPPGSAPR